MAQILRPDTKGRISLGKYAQGISSFHLIIDLQNRIILEPHVEIPAKEKWLFDNKKALKSLQKGIQQADQGSLKSRGSFADFSETPLD